jgi:hypothetical protein
LYHFHKNDRISFLLFPFVVFDGDDNDDVVNDEVDDDNDDYHRCD